MANNKNYEVIHILEDLGINPTDSEREQIMSLRRYDDIERAFVRIRNHHWRLEGYR